MSKSVLVIDTPENCYDCPFGTEYCGNYNYEGNCELAECLGNIMTLITEEHYGCKSESKPDWCPLKPLPEKDDFVNVPHDEYYTGYHDGWDNCIDEITGGNVDD